MLNSKLKLGSGTIIEKEGSMALGDFAVATGANAIAIGSSNGNVQQFVQALGDYDIAIGTEVKADSKGFLGEIKIGSPRLHQSYYDKGWFTNVDERDITNIQNVSNALSFIKELQPIQFRHNYRVDYPNVFPTIIDYNEEEQAKKTNIQANFEYGFKGQEVGQALKNVYGNEFFGNIISKYTEANMEYGVSESYHINMEALIPFLVGAIQEQQEEIEALKAKLGD